MNKLNQYTQIKVYIVGGYVRDRLLGREGRDHDFVVIGATDEIMKKCGFVRVGADFPVYLHPNGDEYALARKERNVAVGYEGFEFETENVTLEEDLLRRDLTINAMAREVLDWNEQGHAILSDTIIDPYNGQRDLADCVLRHVSDAFREDPLRVLRVARFMARYDFGVADNTIDLITDMITNGDLNSLTSERVWKETENALGEKHWRKYFQFLDFVSADLFSDVTPPPKMFWPDSDDVMVRALTWLSNDQLGIALHMLDTLKAPKIYTDNVNRWHLVLRFLLNGDYDGHVVSALFRGTGAYTSKTNTYTCFDALPQYKNETNLLKLALMCAEPVRAAHVIESGESIVPGPQIGNAIASERAHIINRVVLGGSDIVRMELDRATERET